MVNQAVVGSTGTLGRFVIDQVCDGHGFNSSNIQDLAQQEWDTVYVCAPSGNRRRARQCPDQDQHDTDRLIHHLNRGRCRRLVLISTVDTLVYPDTVYGHNRLRLEKFVQERFQSYLIMRLAGLIHSSIQKNILYDLRHETFLDKINLTSVTQWTPLDKIIPLLQDIEFGIINAVSEPISAQEIVQQFRPELLSRVNRDPVGKQCYDVAPYLFDKALIMDYMGEYLA